MKAVGKCLVIEKTKEGTTTTKGGLMLAENQREDIRYIEAKVLSVGEEVVGVKEGDMIFYDRHAGHNIDIDKESKIYLIRELNKLIMVVEDEYRKTRIEYLKLELARLEATDLVELEREEVAI